jgi:hypothetical protein
MKFWHDFLDSLDTDGGHIFILVSLMVMGIVGLRSGIVEGRDILSGAFGALLLALKVAGSNHDRNGSKP